MIVALWFVEGIVGCMACCRSGESWSYGNGGSRDTAFILSSNSRFVVEGNWLRMREFKSFLILEMSSCSYSTMRVPVIVFLEALEPNVMLMFGWEFSLFFC